MICDLSFASNDISSTPSDLSFAPSYMSFEPRDISFAIERFIVSTPGKRYFVHFERFVVCTERYIVFTQRYIDAAQRLGHFRKSILPFLNEWFVSNRTGDIIFPIQIFGTLYIRNICKRPVDACRNTELFFEEKKPLLKRRTKGTLINSYFVKKRVCYRLNERFVSN